MAMAWLRKPSVWGVILIAFAMTTSLWGIAAGPHLGDHESINAQCARQTLVDGHWLTPYFQEHPRVRKPPLGTWLIAWSSMVVDAWREGPPVSDLAARLPQALAAILNVLVIAWLAGRMFDRRTGWVAGFIAAASVATFYFSHSALIEMTLTLFITLAFACFWRAVEGAEVNRRWLIGFYGAFGVAMMAKMPLPLAIILPALAIYWLGVRPALRVADLVEQTPDQAPGDPRALFLQEVRAQLRRVWRLLSAPGIILFLLVCGLWPVYVFLTVDGVRDLFIAEYVDRFLGGMSARTHPFWYYFPLLFGFVAPFSLFLPEAIAAVFLKPYRRYRQALAFLLCWGGWGLVFLSASSFKRPHYLAAVLPPFLLMLAPVVDRYFLGAPTFVGRFSRGLCDVCLIAVLAGAAGGAYVLPRHFPDLGLTLYVALGLLVLLWAVAALSFRFKRRRASLGCLLLSGLALLVAGWSGAGYMDRQDVQVPAVMAALDDLGVKPTDRVVQVDGRVDARFSFYAHREIERLFTPLELVELRPKRRELPAKLMKAAAARMDELLRSDRPTYFLMSEELFERVRGDFDLPAVELTRVALSRAPGGKRFVILGPAQRS